MGKRSEIVALNEHVKKIGEQCMHFMNSELKVMNEEGGEKEYE